MLNALKYERYSRHILLPEIGEAGQQKLLAAKVLVIGAGGLGCPILQYLTAAGVGTIGIADDDIVSLSNLQRQILYTINDIGKPKATISKHKLQQLNEDVQFELYERITNANAWDIINDFDVVIDGSDNFSTRYLVNDACVLMNKPLVYGSILRFEGQVAVFNYDGSANYRDVFPEPPSNDEVTDCAKVGVLGVLAGIIGSMMANEAIKLITGTGTLLANKLLTYNSLYNTFYEIEIERGDKVIPEDRNAFEKMNYDLICNLWSDLKELDLKTFNSFIAQRNATIIDVREHGEQPVINEFEHLHIPLSKLRKKSLIFNDDTIVLFCQQGKEARKQQELSRQAISKVPKYTV